MRKIIPAKFTVFGDVVFEDFEKTEKYIKSHNLNFTLTSLANQILYEANCSDNGEYRFFIGGIGFFSISATYDGYVLQHSQQEIVGNIYVKNIVYEF